MLIDVKVTSALCVKGQRHPAGALLHLAPVEAGHVLLSGRAELADPGQRAAVNAALQAEATRFVGRERGGLVGSFGSGPWQPA